MCGQREIRRIASTVKATSPGSGPRPGKVIRYPDLRSASRSFAASPMLSFRTSRGRPLPLGATRTADGVNFALLCRHGTAVTLVVLPGVRRDTPIGEIALDPRKNRTGDHWHVRVDGLPHDLPLRLARGRADGAASTASTRAASCSTRPRPSSPGRDVWAGTVRGRSRSGPAAAACSTAARRYDWDDDAPPLTPLEDTIIYELHVRGFTCHPSSRRRAPRHLPRAGREDPVPEVARRHRGRTAADPRVRRVRLPVHQPDDRREAASTSGATTPIAFAAPKAAFAASGRGARPGRRVPRHGQGVPRAPASRSSSTWCSTTPARATTAAGRTPSAAWTTSCTTCSTTTASYLNFSGCGNTVNCNHPRRPRPDHDVPAVLGRRHARGRVPVRPGHRSSAATGSGNVMVEPPVIEMIAEDGVLADTKLIAEPWDAAGLYQVGAVPVRPAVERVERPVPRRRAPVLARRRRASPAPLATRLVRQLGPVPVERPAAAALGQLRHLPRRVHAVATWSATTTSTTRPTARTTATASNDELLVELRRRGADRRPGRARAARAGRRRT